MARSRPATITFDPRLSRLPGGGLLRDGLSSAAAIGRTLWVVNDATLTIERLTRLPGTAVRYGEHRQYRLTDYLDLRAPRDGRQFAAGDIEGIDAREGYLWITGSHSLRRNPPNGRGTARSIDAMSHTGRDGNQFLVARIPLVEEDGLHTLAADSGRGPARRAAGQMPGDDTSNLVTEALSEDDHLWPFVAIPGQENGLDVEGLAAGDDGRVFLGLRGPVLGGLAVVIELRVAADARRPSRLGLERMRAADRAARKHPTYRKHFLDLDGLGIRDLRVWGRDLLLLAGPTMDLDGPFRLYRWRGGARTEGESLVSGARLQPLFDLPSSTGGDHAEGLTLLPGDRGEAGRLLVVYERASRARHTGSTGVVGDVFTLPRTR